MGQDVQPEWRPSITAEVNANSAAMTNICAGRSIFRGRSARDSRMKRAVKPSPMTPSGMFTQKIDRQPRLSTSRPPRSGPAAMATPKAAPQIPTARARSLGSRNVLTMIDIATGLSIEPPIACNARDATSTRAFGATLQSNEPILKATSPTWNVLRRPKRSAIAPARSRKLATTMV
jgi:hypothetical protein